jgi:hypothetical protein
VRETTDEKGKFFKDISSRYNILLGVDAKRAHTQEIHTHTFIRENFTSFTAHSRRKRHEVKDVYVVPS